MNLRRNKGQCGDVLLMFSDTVARLRQERAGLTRLSNDGVGRNKPSFTVNDFTFDEWLDAWRLEIASHVLGKVQCRRILSNDVNST